MLASSIPFLLGLVMLTMGMTLGGRDFLPLLKRPWDVAIGVAAQFLVMPLVAWLVVKALGLPAELALGVVLVGACPGNTQGVAKLVVGRKVEDVIALLKGIRCRNGTSCPDQLARAQESGIK